MQKKILYTALLGALLYQSPAWADDATEQRLNTLEQRLQMLEQRLQQQQRMLTEKDQHIAQLQTTKKSAASGSDQWFDKIEMGGVIEVEASHHDPENGDSSNDLSVATVEIGLAAQVNDWTKGEVVFLYEEDDTDFGVDSATITVSPPEGPWFITAGQFGLPFGRFETNLVSDPLTLELGEIYETSLQAGVEMNGFMASAYVFNGDNKKQGDDKIDNFGLDLGYSLKQGDMTWNAALGYLNDVGDTDAMQDTIADNLGSNDVADHVPGWFVSAVFEYGPFIVIGEYLGAADSFQANELAWQAQGAEPQTWNLEAAYAYQVANKEVSVALGYQGSDEALGLGLPENRWLLAFSVGILDNTSLSFEWAHDEDYGVDDGGSGDSSHAFTAQLAVEF